MTFLKVRFVNSKIESSPTSDRTQPNMMEAVRRGCLNGNSTESLSSCFSTPLPSSVPWKMYTMMLTLGDGSAVSHGRDDRRPTYHGGSRYIPVAVSNELDEFAEFLTDWPIECECSGSLHLPIPAPQEHVVREKTLSHCKGQSRSTSSHMSLEPPHSQSQ
jgi:hypothetical protein